MYVGIYCWRWGSVTAWTLSHGMLYVHCMFIRQQCFQAVPGYNLWQENHLGNVKAVSVILTVSPTECRISHGKHVYWDNNQPPPTFRWLERGPLLCINWRRVDYLLRGGNDGPSTWWRKQMVDGASDGRSKWRAKQVLDGSSIWHSKCWMEQVLDGGSVGRRTSLPRQSKLFRHQTRVWRSLRFLQRSIELGSLCHAHASFVSTKVRLAWVPDV